jgi:hypothetical protein
MIQPQSTIKITVVCPQGHRLRGGTKLVGKTIRCPKCRSEFVFAPTKPTPPPNRAVTDTAVMRILGDGPGSPAVESKVDESNHRLISDTGVIRILDDQASAPPPPSTVEMRPCPRCKIPTPEAAAVCEHCNCYLGVMPTFLKQLHGTSDVAQS